MEQITNLCAGAFTWAIVIAVVFLLTYFLVTKVQQGVEPNNLQVPRGNEWIVLRADNPRELEEAMGLQYQIQMGRYSDIAHVELVVPKDMLPKVRPRDERIGRYEDGRQYRILPSGTLEEFKIGFFAEEAEKDDRFSVWVE